MEITTKRGEGCLETALTCRTLFLHVPVGDGSLIIIQGKELRIQRELSSGHSIFMGCMTLDKSINVSDLIGEMRIILQGR